VIHFKSLAQAYYLSFLHNRAAELAGYIVVTIGFCYLAELVVYPWVRRWNVFGGSRRVQPQAVRREGPKQ